MYQLYALRESAAHDYGVVPGVGLLHLIVKDDSGEKMADVLNRATLELRRSVNTPDYPEVEWIINPDLSRVEGFPSKYWQINGGNDTVSLMNRPERDAVDAAEAAAQLSAARTEAAAAISAQGEQGIRFRALLELLTKLNVGKTREDLINEYVAEISAGRAD